MHTYIHTYIGGRAHSSLWRLALAVGLIVSVGAICMHSFLFLLFHLNRYMSTWAVGRLLYSLRWRKGGGDD
jgi:hypothetical protein